MKSLYESLLDDFDDLEKKSNSDIKSSIINFIESNYSGIKKITIKDKITDNGKGVDALIKADPENGIEKDAEFFYNMYIKNPIYKSNR
jgi:hypothetical protein